MRFVGITGHRRIPAEIAQQVRAGMVEVCTTAAPDLVGVTCLAAGADQMFASVVLELKGTLHVIVPSLDYELSFAGDADRARYRELLQQAAHVEWQERYPHHSEPAYLAAGKKVVDQSDLIVAVLDPLRSEKPVGGTADIVEYAKSRAKTVINVWPGGA